MLALWASVALAGADYDQPPVSYSTSKPQDPAAQLQRDLETGQRKLDRHPERGYLDAVLKELRISPASQTLVFSQTSFQRTHISPANPRALYFNDEVYVGYVPGGDVIEVAASDPKLGTVFYTLDQHADASPTPKIIRQTDNCLQCHGESMTRNIPGLLVRSVFPDTSGQPILPAGTFMTTHESPLTERWGGWYVTGAPDAVKHMGNTQYAADGEHAAKSLESSRKQPPLDQEKYLSSDSDIVALMVLEHQTEAHNLITRANYGTLLALRDEKVIADAMGEKLTPGQHSDSTLSRIKSVCQPLVEYLLFAGEAPFPAALDASSSFAAEFAKQGPRDAKGRSLRDFDLKTRLFRHPCSYLIYSESFNGLPDAAKSAVYTTLYEALTGKVTGKCFAHLTPDDRAAIADILRETKLDLRDHWQKLESRAR